MYFHALHWKPGLTHFNVKEYRFELKNVDPPASDTSCLDSEATVYIVI